MLPLLFRIALADEPAPAPEAAPQPAAPAPAAPAAAPHEVLNVDLDAPPVQRWEVTAELSGIVIQDPSWGNLTNSGEVAWGIDAGYHVLPWLTPYVELGYNSAAMTQYGDGVDETGAYTTGESERQFRTLFGQTHARIGARATWSPSPYFGMYGALHLQGLYGDLRMDDDPDDDANPGQLQASGVTGGAGASVGIQAIAPTRSRQVSVLFRMEAGYAWFAPLELGDVGSLDPQGVSIRTGIGLRF